MASETDQLSIDFTKVLHTLELYPGINIIQVEGDPPESYEIEYLLKGYVRDVDGSVRLGSQHRIRITLPFGYPHFPPTVKPLTSLFHPDIDPDAIRIADYWQQNPSLSELILHIGEMACGRVYNLADPFNQEAADWYAEHLADLPLDTLQVADIEPADRKQDAGFDFDILDLEGAASAEEAFDIDGRLDLIRLRIEHKEMHAAGRIVEEIPAAIPLPGREEIEDVIASALRESDALLKQAEQQEDRGAIEQALETVATAAGIVADTPGLDEIRFRLEQARMLAGSFGEEETEESEAASQESSPRKEGKKQAKEEGGRSKFRPVIGSRLPIIPLVAGLLLLLVAGGGGSIFFRDNAAINQAEQGLQQAQNQLQNKQYQDAEQSALKALASMDRVLLFRSRQKAIQDNLSGLLNSTDLKRGLQGMVLYNDQYLPPEVVATLQQLEQLIRDGERFNSEGRIDEAVAVYEKALQLAREKGMESREQTIRKTVNNLRFEETMARAREAEDAKQWGNAAQTYQRALELSKTLADADEHSEINKKLLAATFRHELDQSRATFTGAQWQQTIELLENARKLLAADHEAISAEERRELDRLLADSRLYQILSLARQAYDQRDWSGAVKEYQRSLDMIRQEQDIFAGAHDSAVAKIEKTILMISISVEQNAATGAEEDNDLKKALAHYKKITALISGYGFAKDAPIVEIEKNAGEQIKSIQAQVALENRLAWLKDNFETIFKHAYPSSRSSQLSHPKAQFVKEENGKQIFYLACVERSQGSSFRLELKYQFDPATRSWSLYYDQ